MGMYTELILGCSLKSDTPVEVLATLADMMGKQDILEELQIKYNFVLDNFEPVFATSTGRNVLLGASYYFLPQPCNFMWFDDVLPKGRWFISTRSNIKNYDNEIDQFLTWLKPYIDGGSSTADRQFYAITCYEEGFPEFHYLDN